MCNNIRCKKNVSIYLKFIQQNLEKEKCLNQNKFTQYFKLNHFKDNHVYWTADAKLDTSINEPIQIEDDKYEQDQKEFQIEILALKTEQNLNLQCILEEKKELENNLSEAMDEQLNLKK